MEKKLNEQKLLDDELKESTKKLVKAMIGFTTITSLDVIYKILKEDGHKEEEIKKRLDKAELILSGKFEEFFQILMLMAYNDNQPI